MSNLLTDKIGIVRNWEIQKQGHFHSKLIIPKYHYLEWLKEENPQGRTQN